MPRISALQQKIRAAATDELPAVDTENGGTKKLDVAMIMPTGAVLDYAGTNPPDGWLLCYGQTLNAQTNPEYQPLYEAIGNQWGGSSNQDFALPDARGRVVAGADNMGGTAANRLTAARLGTAAVFAAVGGSESHSHTLDAGRADISPTGTDLRLRRLDESFTGNVRFAASGGSTESATMPYKTALSGSTDPGSTVQPTIIMNKIIKY